MKLTPTHTKLAAYVGYMTQAITINFFPLLFVTLSREYGFSLIEISTLIAISFTTQLITDAVTAKFAPKRALRTMAVVAHVLAALGMVAFATLPSFLPIPFLSFSLAVIIAAVGAGLIEVLISPIVEACPTGKKSAAMSLLHSFYSWGLAGVVLLSTLFFEFFGTENWRILSCLWGIIPTIGALAFCIVPIYHLEDTTPVFGEHKPPRLRSSRLFWVFLIVMICAGAAEQIMGQWASDFAESGLGVSKALGDLLGPCAFAIFMGSARVLYAKMSGRIHLRVSFVLSAFLCIITYLVAALSPHPLPALIACAVCGFSVGLLWPGTYSLAARAIPHGGVRMFALLALGGDIGCLLGPTMAGAIASLFGGDLRVSFLFSLIFPVAILMLLFLSREKKEKI